MSPSPRFFCLLSLSLFRTLSPSLFPPSVPLALSACLVRTFRECKHSTERKPSPRSLIRAATSTPQKRPTAKTKPPFRRSTIDRAFKIQICLGSSFYGSNRLSVHRLKPRHDDLVGRPKRAVSIGF